jgi:hypothetical protein
MQDKSTNGGKTGGVTDSGIEGDIGSANQRASAELEEGACFNDATLPPFVTRESSI